MVVSTVSICVACTVSSSVVCSTVLCVCVCTSSKICGSVPFISYTQFRIC